jgi:hypothetical protein
MSLYFKAMASYVASVCEAITCVGTTQCPVYCFERSYTNEPSKTCNGEYRGEIILELCAGNMARAGGGQRLTYATEGVANVGGWGTYEFAALDCAVCVI